MASQMVTLYFTALCTDWVTGGPVQRAFSWLVTPAHLMM